MNRRLYRSRTDSVIGGVAGGVAEYLDLDPSIVRIVWAILVIVTAGVFFVLYLVMWVVVPETPAGPYQRVASEPAGEPAPGSSEAPAPEVRAAEWSARQAERSRSGGGGGTAGPVIFGLLLVAIGAWFLVDEYLPAIDMDLVWPLALVVIGVGLVFVSMRRH